MKQLVLIITIITTLMGCDNKIHINAFNKVGVVLKYDSEPTLGNEVCGLMYTINSNYKIKTAYYDCDINQIKSIDEKANVINGCKTKLQSENDTVYLCLTPGKLGIRHLPNVTLLLIDTNGNFVIADSTSIILEVK